jgi:hypothetical protein
MMTNVANKAITPETDERDLFERRTIAAAAMVDVRSLERALSGLYVRPAIMCRIRKQLRIRLLEHLLNNK